MKKKFTITAFVLVALIIIIALHWYNGKMQPITALLHILPLAVITFQILYKID